MLVLYWCCLCWRCCGLMRQAATTLVLALLWIDAAGCNYACAGAAASAAAVASWQRHLAHLQGADQVALQLLLLLRLWWWLTPTKLAGCLAVWLAG
jgi:hypothetical protein